MLPCDSILWLLTSSAPRAGVQGYATGDPNKRHPGSALGYLGHYTLFGAVIRFAIQLIRA